MASIELLTNQTTKLKNWPPTQAFSSLPITSLAGVFRGVRISSLPTGGTKYELPLKRLRGRLPSPQRDETRAPLKTTAWEATQELVAWDCHQEEKEYP